ncbi:MAG: acetyl-CoA synthetase [Desulfovibrionales bacterium]|nr:acetyl-CoA synthetase [Desulfovibrionales bacterium]
MQKIDCNSYEELLEKFTLDVPANFNFAYDVLDAMALATPTATAMIHVDDAGRAATYDFAWFREQSDRLASGLAEQGLAAGDPVMLILYRRVEFWVSMLALHKIGAVPVPSPSLLTGPDIEFRINHAKIRCAIVEDSVDDRVDSVRSECPSLNLCVQVGEAPLRDGWVSYRDVVEQAKPFTPPEPRPGGRDPLLVFFTSGTTGMPKMVSHDHTYPIGHWITGVYWHDLREGDLHLTLADTGWGKAVWGKFYGQWMAKAAIFVWDFRGKFDPQGLLQILSEYKITSFCAPPTVYRFLIRQELENYDLSHLRHCTTAGELLNAGVFLAWKEATGLPIYEGYGQTETCLQIATLPFMEPKPGSIGRPAPGWELALFDDDGALCDVGQEGEICIKVAPKKPVGLFTGYLEEPGRTAAAMPDGYYHTGDKAWMDEDGYFWFLGRTDDLIKSSGYRIGPFEVESALITHPAVMEAAVTGVPDPIRGQAVKATLALAPGYESSDELTKDIQKHVKSVTAPYKYPRIIEYVDELPKTISGKIKRAEIRARDMKKYRK